MARQQEEGDPVVAAIEHVLTTERDGAHELQQSQEQAEQLQAQARAQAAAIAQRADAIIARLYNNYLQKVQRDIEKLTRSAISSSEHNEAQDRATLVRAVARVAAKLTGGS